MKKTSIILMILFILLCFNVVAIELGNVSINIDFNVDADRPYYNSNCSSGMGNWTFDDMDRDLGTMVLQSMHIDNNFLFCWNNATYFAVQPIFRNMTGISDLPAHPALTGDYLRFNTNGVSGYEANTLLDKRLDTSIYVNDFNYQVSCEADTDGESILRSFLYFGNDTDIYLLLKLTGDTNSCVADASRIFPKAACCARAFMGTCYDSSAPYTWQNINMDMDTIIGGCNAFGVNETIFQGQETTRVGIYQDTATGGRLIRYQSLNVSFTIPPTNSPPHITNATKDLYANTTFLCLDPDTHIAQFNISDLEWVDDENDTIYYATDVQNFAKIKIDSEESFQDLSDLGGCNRDLDFFNSPYLYTNNTIMPFLNPVLQTFLYLLGSRSYMDMVERLDSDGNCNPYLKMYGNVDDFTVLPHNMAFSKNRAYAKGYLPKNGANITISVLNPDWSNKANVTIGRFNDNMTIYYNGSLVGNAEITREKWIGDFWTATFTSNNETSLDLYVRTDVVLFLVQDIPVDEISTRGMQFSTDQDVLGSWYLEYFNFFTFNETIYYPLEYYNFTATKPENIIFTQDSNWVIDIVTTDLKYIDGNYTPFKYKTYSLTIDVYESDFCYDTINPIVKIEDDIINGIDIGDYDLTTFGGYIKLFLYLLRIPRNLMNSFGILNIGIWAMSLVVVIFFVYTLINSNMDTNPFLSTTIKTGLLSLLLQFMGLITVYIFAIFMLLLGISLAMLIIPHGGGANE